MINWKHKRDGLALVLQAGAANQTSGLCIFPALAYRYTHEHKQFHIHTPPKPDEADIIASHFTHEEIGVQRIK